MRSPMTIPQYIEHVKYRLYYYGVQHELAEDKDFWQGLIDQDEKELLRIERMCNKYSLVDFCPHP